MKLKLQAKILQLFKLFGLKASNFIEILKTKVKFSNQEEGNTKKDATNQLLERVESLNL